MFLKWFHKGAPPSKTSCFYSEPLADKLSWFSGGREPLPHASGGRVCDHGFSIRIGFPLFLISPISVQARWSPEWTGSSSTDIENQCPQKNKKNAVALVIKFSKEGILKLRHAESVSTTKKQKMTMRGGGAHGENGVAGWSQ